MHKTFVFRIYPTKSQTTLLQNTLNECRWLYNYFLEQRRDAWQERQESVTCFDQSGSLPALKKEHTSLTRVHSQVLANVAVRIDLAFKAFFRRIKAGDKPGYPRFRGEGRYDSFCYPQNGWSIDFESQTIRLSKIGTVKAVLHRLVHGTIKTCTVRRSPTGKWYVCFSCENVPKDTVPETVDQLGIDVGLTSFATFSTGETIPNPRFFRRDEKALAKAQRKFSKEAKGTSARKMRRRVVSQIHERIADRRSNFAHQESRKIINQASLIAVEDLSVNQMTHNHCLTKSIHDVGWNQFVIYLTYKAESAGRQFVKVNPAYTSQTCSRCGHRQPLLLAERIFACLCCNLRLDRDHNAALNILRLGQQSLA